MANEEQLAILKQGVDVWNTWMDDIGIKAWHLVDLSKADLSGMNLTGIELSCINLQNANLGNTNLGNAIFIETDLRGVDFSQANLFRARFIEGEFEKANFWNANLVGAEFWETDLSGINFREADLTECRFIHSDFNETQFQGSELNTTVFGNSNLSGAQGLDKCNFTIRCIVDESTLFLSSGLPIEFLRGIGLSEEYINYLPSLRAAASDSISLYSTFISHNIEDKPFARWIYNQLQERGVRCWLDEKDIEAGEDFHNAIERGIKHFDKLIVCCSKDSLNSWWVDTEIEKAQKKERALWKSLNRKVNVLLPLNLDNYLFNDDYEDGKASTLQKLNALDFTGWQEGVNEDKYTEQIERLIKALRADSGGKPPPPISAWE